MSAEVNEVVNTLAEPIEARWREKQPFLASKSYMLRPRFHPDWEPSWNGVDKDKAECEDSISLPLREDVIDARRMSDDKPVYIKRVETDDNETRIACMLSSEGCRNDPRNHAVPILDHFEDDVNPSVSYLVMPLLRAVDDPPFETVEDIADFCGQILEGLAFQYEKGVAHRDCSYRNIMMDAMGLYPHGYHPVNNNMLPDGITPATPLSRSAHRESIRYYFIDFGISIVMPPMAKAKAKPRMVKGHDGRDRDPPELHSDDPYDPFKLDMFIVGNLFRQTLLEKYSNIEFLLPLVSTMTQDDPASRPNAAQALQQWRSIQGELWKAQLRRELTSRGAPEGSQPGLSHSAYRLGRVVFTKSWAWFQRMFVL
ncbi:hypothetical protein BXZ70DRAFT_895290 [Cristinia sonorae]|uniref:Protein kinase domain-containing protein n=1 Tax=Cristinia sonorae TaxID=1940300 RepID=A0A8K0XNM4_9AGAR|nr:hypothetical protein BXZ70DRAFT_895290 [Cristinia sonorae]